MSPMSVLFWSMLFLFIVSALMLVVNIVQNAMREAERKQIQRENRQFAEVQGYVHREVPVYESAWYDNPRLWAILAVLAFIGLCALAVFALTDFPAYVAEGPGQDSAVEQSNCFTNPDECLGVEEDEFKDGVSIHESMRAYFAQQGFDGLVLKQVGFGSGQNLQQVLANYKGYRVAILFVNDPAELPGFQKMTCAGWFGTVPGTIPSIPLQSNGAVVVYDSVLADSVIQNFYTGWAINHPVCSD